jgi:hypothetical protein
MASEAKTNPNSTNTSNVESSTQRAKKPMILMMDVVVLLSASVSHDILPAPIVSNFPHIHLQLGSKLDDANCLVVRCVVDMTVALSTGNFLSQQSRSAIPIAS